MCVCSCMCVCALCLCVSVCVLSALCGPLWAVLQQVCSGTAALSRALDFHRLLHLLSSFIWFYFIFVSILRIASLRQLNAACYEGAGWLMNYLNATCLLLCVEPGNLWSLPLLSSIVRECHQKLARLHRRHLPPSSTFNYISQSRHTHRPTQTHPRNPHNVKVACQQPLTSRPNNRPVIGPTFDEGCHRRRQTNENICSAKSNSSNHSSSSSTSGSSSRSSPNECPY